MTSPYYPDNPCHLAPLRPADPAPKPDCDCAVCVAVRKQDDEWVPVVLSRSPFFGLLKRRSELTNG